MEHMNDTLRWSKLWNALALPCPIEAVFEDLQGRYAEPHRSYHTWQHVQECLVSLDRVRGGCAHPAEVELAILFHDAIYDPHRPDNEEMSARLAIALLRECGAPAEMVSRVGQLILATEHTAVELQGDAALLVDIDLAILGADPARFDEYEFQVRGEYAWVPNDLFQAKRREILQGFLARQAIYCTGEFAGLEQQARDNLARSLGTD